MTKAVFAGSFDPFTLGHVSVVERAAVIFDHVYLAVAENAAKQYWFSVSERVKLAQASVAHLPNVEVVPVSGLLANWCASQGVTVIVKGVRGSVDFEYELPQAVINRSLAPVETVFFAADPQVAHISSSLVKELARLGGNIENLVSKPVFDALNRKLEAN